MLVKSLMYKGFSGEFEGRGNGEKNERKTTKENDSNTILT